MTTGYSGESMQLIILLLSVLFLQACDQSSDPQSNIDKRQATATQDDEISEDLKEQEPEPFTGVTCSDQEIPSWDRVIQNLSEQRCMNCHNDKFAWNDIKLHTYNDFKANGEISKERLAEGDLTIDIFLYEVELFNQWFDADMPETEEDCPQEEG